ncbi:unnamed protein product [Phaedon cochleariae]|uniref:SUEL-type lectin domain-containing protein n=1 Tax=Phaedon cochleariae TaxID=80249 RepID=A0A9N9SG10_PHACE|nr:unnamed protein product [Phaedon cochleariae]
MLRQQKPKSEIMKNYNGYADEGTLRTYQRAGCDDEVVTLKCPPGTSISIEIAQYGKAAPTKTLCGTRSTPTAASRTSYSYNVSCLWPNAIQTVVEACQKKRQCKFQTNPKTFGGDPCPGIRKYVEVAYKCRPYEFRSKVACENERIQLKCNPNSRVAVYSASYGRTEYESIQCPQPQGVPEETCLVSYATETVMQLCHGKRSCDLSADISTFGSPCKPESRMYLKVVYTCVPRRVLKDQYEGVLEPDETAEEPSNDEDDDFETYDAGNEYIRESAASPPAPNIEGVAKDNFTKDLDDISSKLPPYKSNGLDFVATVLVTNLDQIDENPILNFELEQFHLLRKMNRRGLLLVNMVRKIDKENASPNIPSQNENLQAAISEQRDLTISTDQSNQQSSTSTSSVAQLKNKRTDYYISPIHSDESDFDDSDADPNFVISPDEPGPSKVIFSPISPSSGSSSSSSSSNSSSSDSSCSDTDTENNNAVHLDDHRLNIEDNSTIVENQDQNPVTEVKKGRKRARNPSTWKTKVAKTLRNSGRAYNSLSKSKKHVPERKLRPPCGAKCRLSCKSNFDEPSRQKLFSAYWELADLQRQREFIVRHSQEIKPKYRYSSTQNFRALNTAFYFESDGTRIRVCKAFFKSTLDLNDRVIKTALSKKSESGVIEGELRGKHGNQPTIDPQVRRSVIDFINSIPRIESHYLRAQTTREFICSDKSLADLYRDYKILRENNGLPYATTSTFNRIFNTDFNISFFIPKKDQCDLCESYKNADETGKEKLYQNYEQHLKEKTLARIEKDNDKNRTDGTIVAVYDLQAVMQVPKGQVSLFFYKSRINCLNFTVSDLEVKNVVCYFWDETEGARGAVEIGSCILDYIKAQSERNPENGIEIIFYSDNCCGQQKNKYLLSVYAYAVINMNVKSITHKFLIRGHSQNEAPYQPIATRPHSRADVSEPNCTITVYVQTREDKRVIGFVSEWINAYTFVSQNQERFFLYLIVSVAASLLLLLSFLVGRLLLQRHRARRDAKFHATNISDNSLPNGFTDDISEVDADIDLTTPLPCPVPSVTIHSPPIGSIAEVVRYPHIHSHTLRRPVHMVEAELPRGLSTVPSSHYYYG